MTPAGSPRPRELLGLADTGFGPKKRGEDPFDALVGALVLALVALGHDSAADSTSAEATAARAAQVPGLVSTAVSQTVLSITESTRATLLAALARGDIPAAIVAYEAHVGRPAPVWLLNLRTAYSAASQAVGQCQNVARAIHTAYSKLGQRPEYIAFRAREKYEFITFDLPNGTSPAITHSGYHVAVKLGDVIRDAYTGPLGMKLSDYLLRLQARRGIEWQLVESP